MYRRKNASIEFFLVHPGGPFFARKDLEAWTIPKGLVNDNEELEAAARREFGEETGLPVRGELTRIGSIKMKSGKIIHAWVFEGKWNDDDGIKSNTFSLEWPLRSGRYVEFPEADRAAWFDFDTAMRKINQNQRPFLIRAMDLLK